MKRDGILNPHLSKVIAGMGHGQMLVVCDAGFPVPEGKECVDVSLVADVPTIPVVLEAIKQELIVEAVWISEELESHNPDHFEAVTALFPGVPQRRFDRDELFGLIPKKAKAFVRTGALMPWGNVGLVSGIDEDRWFDRPRLVRPKDLSARG